VGEGLFLTSIRIAGGSAVIVGAIHAFFRFLRWAIEFSCGRAGMARPGVQRGGLVELRFRRGPDGRLRRNCGFPSLTQIKPTASTRT
jgi:hypothetical protein